MSVRPLIALVRKDLKVFFTDRRAVIISFAAPLILASFFAIVFGRGAGKAKASGEEVEAARMNVDVVDLDGSEVSREIVEALRSDSLLAITQRDAEKAREDVKKGRAVASLVMPERFGEESSASVFRGGEKPDLIILHDPGHRAEAGMVRGILTQHVVKVVMSRAFSTRGLKDVLDRRADIEKSDMSVLDKAALLAMLRGVSNWTERLEAREQDGTHPGSGGSSMGGFTLPFEPREEAVTAGEIDEQVSAYAHAFGGMAVQFLLFGAVEAGVGLLLERQRGLWKRLRSAPIPRWLLLLAKGISGTIISMTILGVIFLFGALVFGIRVVGNPLGFVLVCLAYATTSASFGLLVAALGKTPQAARSLSVLAVLVMVMLGGAWVPTILFPAWLQKVTPLIPTRWAVDGFGGTLARGFSLAEAMPSVAALFGFTAVFATLATLRFRWEVEGG